MPTAEEEGLILADRPAQLKAILVQLDERLVQSLGLGIEFIGVQRRIAEELEGRAVELVGAAARRHRDISAGVTSLFGRRIRRRHFEFLYVVRVQPENVVHRIRVGVLIGLNAVDGDVHRAGAGAVDADGATGALHHAGLVNQQVQGIAPVQRQGFDGLMLHHIAQRGVVSLQRFGGRLDVDRLGGRADIERGIHGGGCVDLQDDLRQLKALEAGLFDD